MGLLFRWARFLARYRWVVIGVWLAILVVAAPLAKNVTHRLSSSGFENPSSQSAWVDTQLSHLRGGGGGAATLLIEHASLGRVRAWASASGLPSTRVYQLQAADSSVLIPPSGRDVVPAKIIGEETTFRRAADRGGATVTVVSDAAVGEKVTQGAKTTLAQSLPLALPVLLLLLLVVFGSVASAALPLLVAAVGAVLALGVLDLLENVMTLSSYLTDIVSFLALGVGVDYALFISMRFRSERDAQVDPDHAVAETMRHAGRSVLYSGIAVALALSSLLLGGNAYWRGIAVGGAVAVACVLAATHTLLPALIRLFGRRLDWGRIRVLGTGRLWAAISTLVEGHPVWAIILGIAILGVPAWFGRDLIIRTPANLALELPVSDPLRQAVNKQQQVLGAGFNGPVVLALRLPSTVTKPTYWDEVARVTNKAMALPDVRGVASPVTLGVPTTALAALAAHPDRMPPALRTGLQSFINPAYSPHMVVLYVTPKSGPDSPRTTALVKRLQQDLPHWVPPGSRTGVGGVTALLNGFNHLTGRRLPLMMAAVAFVAFAILFMATGSLWQPLLGVAFDGLVALATAGLLVLTVQRGGFGLYPLPPDSAITPLIFVLLFGLSMDYEVILLHRVQEHVDRAGAREAAARGLKSTGAMITGAGMIMVVVFLALIKSPLEIMQTLAIGMTGAILLDTWVVRSLLVPGSIALLDRFAFWPWGTHRGEAAAEVD